LITPPYGLVLLMASKFVGVRFSQALRATLRSMSCFWSRFSFCIYFPKVGAVDSEAGHSDGGRLLRKSQRHRVYLSTVGATLTSGNTMAEIDSRPQLKAPPGACDTHMHIYDSR